MSNLALAALPPDQTFDSPAELEPTAISFHGRSLAEYAQCFALDVAALKGRDVLDVAAGASSFTAEACARRIDAVALDPLYGEAPAALATRVARDSAQLLAQLKSKPRLFRSKAFPSCAETAADRCAAGQRFLSDYATHSAYGRYVGGSLPQLPFFDGTFDLVLCAHLLFLETAGFDFEGHLAACRELVRVSVGEARVFPLGGAAGRPYPGLARLRRELRAGGIGSQIVEVDSGFPGGAGSTLVLRRAEP